MFLRKIFSPGSEEYPCNVSKIYFLQVLKYIPVMARPLVLLREQHPVRWTGVYADIEV